MPNADLFLMVTVAAVGDRSGFCSVVASAAEFPLKDFIHLYVACPFRAQKQLIVAVLADHTHCGMIGMGKSHISGCGTGEENIAAA